MHALARRYTLPADAPRRREWGEDETERFDRYIPLEYQEVHRRGEELFRWARSLPKDSRGYALIHADLMLGNFVIDGRVLRPFDLDDSHFGRVVNDIAIAYHRAVMIHLRYGNGSDAPDWLRGSNLSQFEQLFLGCFIEGYEQFNNLPVGWRNLLTGFLGLRHIVLFNSICQHGMSNATTQEQWEFFERYRRVIELGLWPSTPDNEHP